MAFVGNRPNDLLSQRATNSTEDEPGRLVIDMNASAPSNALDARAPTPRMQQAAASQVQMAAAANPQLMNPYFLAAAQMQPSHASMLLQGAKTPMGLSPSAALSQLLQAQVVAQYPYSLLAAPNTGQTLAAMYYQQLAALQQQLQQQQQQQQQSMVAVPPVVASGTKTNLRITGEPPVQPPSVPLSHPDTARHSMSNGQAASSVQQQATLAAAAAANKPLSFNSPEAVKDHISRLIEANEAIVEPSPVLLKRRTYHRQHATVGEQHSLGSLSLDSQQSLSPRAPKMAAGRSQSLIEPLPKAPVRMPNPQLPTAAPARAVLLCKFCRVEFWNQQSLEAHEFRCSKREASESQEPQPSAPQTTSPQNVGSPLTQQRQALKKRWLAQVVEEDRVQEERKAKVAKLETVPEHAPVVSKPATSSDQQTKVLQPKASKPRAAQAQNPGLFPQVSLSSNEESRLFEPYSMTVKTAESTPQDIPRTGKRPRNITETTFVCLKRPQPSFVQQKDSKLSMYSNWQQLPVSAQDAKLNVLWMSGCATKRRRGIRAGCNYSNAQTDMAAMRMIHSSVWEFSKKNKQKEPEKKDVKVEPSASGSRSDSATQTPQSRKVKEAAAEQKPIQEETKEKLKDALSGRQHGPKPHRTMICNGGYRTDERYEYVPGRGRGRYVCDRCGIRCKKPSMLKKHIRTHQNLRPYPCSECSFSFKTKGNFTKHLKSKAHSRKTTSGTDCPHDESDTDMDDDKLMIDCPSDSDETESGSERTKSPDRLMQYSSNSWRCSRQDTPLRCAYTPQPTLGEDCDFANDCRNCLSAPPCILTPESEPIIKSELVLGEGPNCVSSTQYNLPTTVAAALSGAAPDEISPFLQATEDRAKCQLCAKEFRKTSELRLHMNVHYYNEQSTRNRYVYVCPFCKANLRSKTLLTKHMECVHPDQPFDYTAVEVADKIDARSTSENADGGALMQNGEAKVAANGGNKTNNPRPFECVDCGTAFRIHGHLAKHLRSKIHVMKLEGQGKLPVGTFHRIESNGQCLNDVDTTDCDRALASLQQLAKTLLVNEQRQQNTEPDLACEEQLSPSPPPAAPPSPPATSSSADSLKSVAAGLWMPPKADGVLDSKNKRCPSADNSASLAGAKLLLEAAAAAEGALSNSDRAESPQPTPSVDNTMETIAVCNVTLCRFCLIEFDTPKELDIHLHADHIAMRDGKNFKCPRRNCDKVYPSRDNLRHHIAAAHFSSGGAVTNGTDVKLCDTAGQAPGDVSRETMAALHRKLSANNGPTTQVPVTGGGNSPGAPEESHTVGRAKLKTHLVKLNSIPECWGGASTSQDFKSPSSVDNSPLSNESSDIPSRGSSRQSGGSPCLPLPTSAKHLIKRRSTEDAVSPLASGGSKRPATPSAEPQTEMAARRCASATPTRPRAQQPPPKMAPNLAPWLAAQQLLAQQNKPPLLAAAYWYNQHHQQQQQSEAVVELPCAVCGKCYGSPLALQEHYLLTHVCDRPHVCPHCDAGFTTAQALAAHAESHQSSSQTS